MLQFNESSLLPRYQEPLVITAILKGFGTSVGRLERMSAALACLRAGATVLELIINSDLGWQDYVQFCNEDTGRLRMAAPRALLSIDGGSLLRPRWDLGRCPPDVAAILGSLDPRPDFISLRIDPVGSHVDSAPMDMTSPALDTTVNNLPLLRANRIQAFFLMRDLQAIEVLERLVRSGRYMGPINPCMLAASGGGIGRNLLDWVEFLRRAPAGSKVAFQSSAAAGPALVALAIAAGIHVRVIAEHDGAEGDQASRAAACVRRVVRAARQFGRRIATFDDARRILRAGIWHDSVEETLFVLGMLPGR